MVGSSQTDLPGVTDPRTWESTHRILDPIRPHRLVQNPGADRLAVLTGREREVVDRLVAGLSNKEVARELGISYRTVEVHRARIMDKTQARSFSELVRLALGVGHPHSGTSNPVETLAPALVDGR